MNIQRHARRTLAGLTICLAFNAAPAMTASKGGKPDGASDAVLAFYHFHFAHSKDFLRTNVKRRRRWLTPELYGLLMNEFRRYDLHLKAHPDDAPYMEGDPFTNTQEYPDANRVGTSVMGSDGKALVPVTFFWHGRESGKIKVEVIRRGNAWLISNILGGSNEVDLVTQLRRPMYDAEVKRPD